MNVNDAKRAAFRRALATTKMQFKFTVLRPETKMALESAAFYLTDPKTQVTPSDTPGMPPTVATFTLEDASKVFVETEKQYAEAVKLSTGLHEITPLATRK